MSRVYLCLCKGRKLGNTKHDWESLVLALGASESLLALIRGLVIYDQILEDQFIWSKALLSRIGSSLVLHICIHRVESSRQNQEKCSKSDSNNKYAIYRNTRGNDYFLLIAIHKVFTEKGEAELDFEEQVKISEGKHYR